MARNLAVGAPPLAQSTRSTITWALANDAHAPDGGVTWSPPTPQFMETMTAWQRSGGGTGRLIASVLATYDNRPWRWPLHWTRRALALGISAESSDNTSYAWFRLRVPILALSMGFGVLGPLALVGAVFWGRRRWARAIRRGDAPAALVLYGVLMVMALSAVFPLGRYRLFLLPIAAPLAARALVGGWVALRARRWSRLCWMAALVASVALGQWGLTRATPGWGLRATDFCVASDIYMQWRRPDLALSEVEDGLGRGVGGDAMAVRRLVALGLIERLAGREAAAVQYYRQALDIARRAGYDSLAGEIAGQIGDQ